ncbi:RNA polymerase sigma-70 factor, ECF subfamily [Zhouia amylolytica]|nr:RNA polymerase sigma factor [Zhouia amylolytica]MCQ0109954.1 RNA polymerase sigma factor [Zhouia amylolytica]SFT09935.1 RNA polymerase sigma-70 factor, ECF subfamily [Zhouia amylolytica]
MSRSNLDIEALLQLCKKGDKVAQMEVYKRYFKAMYNIAVRIVHDPYEAEDVLQESFLSAFTKLDSYRGDTTFGAWLKRIVVNNSIYHYRKQQKNDDVPLDDVMYRVEDNDGIDPDHDFKNMKAQKVLETMKTLKDNYRVSLTLHLIEGYDYEEISEIMGMSYANCRTTISRAKASLRKKLTEVWT